MTGKKVIVSNKTALTRKYQAAGVSAIETALQSLITADAARGITTSIVWLDDPSLGASQVKNFGDPAQNKQAVDSVFNATTPDYLMILGSKDVVPHQDLLNPVFKENGQDKDRYAFADLPYACPGGYSNNISDFKNPTRVVGRLPDVTGATSPGYLINLLTIAAGYTSLGANDYQKFLGVSAQVWEKSTTLSLQNIFGGLANPRIAPPEGPLWNINDVKARSHFFNCHGSASDPKFFGQDDVRFSIAHQAAYLPGKITEGTVVSAECCYGAELYDPAVLASRQMGIANTYLNEKAYAFFGSTNIAYGPSEGNGAADLICQFFLRSILSGASAGRACLEARQKFIASATTMTPVDDKTLGQFILLGDPSIQPVIPAASQIKTFIFSKSGESPLIEQESQARSSRRHKLMLSGLALESSSSSCLEDTESLVPDVVKKMISDRSTADQVGEIGYQSFRVIPAKVSRFQILMGNKGFALDTPHRMYVATASQPMKDETIKKIVAYIVTENDAGFMLQIMYSK